jgi:hypothetical protein
METALIIGVGLVVLFVLFKIFKAFLKWAVILVLLFLVISYFTNPDESVHRKNLDDQAKNLSLRKIRQRLVDIDDYKFFSLTKVTVDGEKKIVGIGAFGKVWYFDDLKEKLKNK